MGSNPKYAKLLEPGYIGKLRLKNRIIKPAAEDGYSKAEGPTDETIQFYEAVAKGGSGLVIFGNVPVEWPRGSLHPSSGEPRLNDDKYIPRYGPMVKAVHKYGAAFFIQLMHSGPWFYDEKMPAGDRIGPSPLTREELPGPRFVTTRELPTAEVEDIVEIFVTVVERAQKAGFDGVEINGAHHHLINAFLSPFWNRRHDRYGCDSLENRARFMTDIIRESKRRCGQEYPVTALINAHEYGTDKGTTLDEAKVFAQLLQRAGADAIQVRPNGYGMYDGILQADRFRYPVLMERYRVKYLDWSRDGRGVTVPLGAAVKQAVSVPVFLACRLDPELGEEILRQGKLDFIAMARRLIADPELPNKIAAGRLEDIAPCSGCNYCWHVRAFEGVATRCRINAAWGRGLDYELKPADQKKKVVIVGAGPSGLEAARVAALRGHQVYLYEKEPRVGGLMPLAALVKDHELACIVKLIEYLQRQVVKAGGTIRLGQEVNPSVVAEIKPEVLILASGGIAQMPDIPGIHHRKVKDAVQLHHQLKGYLRYFSPQALERLTKLWMPIGKKVVIIGGALQGCQLAEFLAKRGRKVTIVESGEKIGEGLLADDPERLFHWFNTRGVIMLAGVKYIEINDRGLVIETKEGQRQTLEADTIITALPLRSDEKLLESLKGGVKEVYQIGDSVKPAYMPDAIADGSRIGREI
jgi:2,4-dienoyl-CoA reductase-like NADH-dependent reductase (Old Yellow Enzyme family)/thioredoxin reductase